jgi:hypothetical protein
MTVNLIFKKIVAVYTTHLEGYDSDYFYKTTEQKIYNDFLAIATHVPSLVPYAIKKIREQRDFIFSQYRDYVEGYSEEVSALYKKCDCALAGLFKINKQVVDDGYFGMSVLANYFSVRDMLPTDIQHILYMPSGPDISTPIMLSANSTHSTVTIYMGDIAGVNFDQLREYLKNPPTKIHTEWWKTTKYNSGIFISANQAMVSMEIKLFQELMYLGIDLNSVSINEKNQIILSDVTTYFNAEPKTYLIQFEHVDLTDPTSLKELTSKHKNEIDLYMEKASLWLSSDHLINWMKGVLTPLGTIARSFPHEDKSLSKRYQKDWDEGLLKDFHAPVSDVYQEAMFLFMQPKLALNVLTEKLEVVFYDSYRTLCQVLVKEKAAGCKQDKTQKEVVLDAMEAQRQSRDPSICLVC